MVAGSAGRLRDGAGRSDCTAVATDRSPIGFSGPSRSLFPVLLAVVATAVGSMVPGIEQDRGFIEIHGAAATHWNVDKWDWYRDLVGQRFVDHPTERWDRGTRLPGPTATARSGTPISVTIRLSIATPTTFSTYGAGPVSARPIAGPRACCQH